VADAVSVGWVCGLLFPEFPEIRLGIRKLSPCTSTSRDIPVSYDINSLLLETGNWTLIQGIAVAAGSADCGISAQCGCS
jgi:hypothetical protein